MKIQIVLVAVLALSLSEKAFAQQPSASFAELVSTLKVSDYVRVAGRNGKRVTGRVASLGAASLSLSVSNQLRKRTLSYSETEVLAIEKIHRDSTLNGTLIGGAAGTALMLTALFSGGGSDGFADGGAVILGGFAGALGFGAGAWIGSTIDGAHNKHETVFRSSNSTTRLLNIKPLVTKQGKGVAVLMRF
jgi:hypothetical protein